MLRINGRDYELKYSINTLCNMCDNGIDVMHMDQIVINVKTIRELFMYGLRHDVKKITQKRAGEWMDKYMDEGGTFNSLVEEVMDSLGKSLGGDESEDDGEEGK
mgnify:CR=1 FL=1